MLCACDITPSEVLQRQRLAPSDSADDIIVIDDVDSGPRHAAPDRANFSMAVVNRRGGTHNPPSTLGSLGSCYAGGDRSQTGRPPAVRCLEGFAHVVTQRVERPDRRRFQRGALAASAIDFASAAPAANASQQKMIHSPSASGRPVPNASDSTR